MVKNFRVLLSLKTERARFRSWVTWDILNVSMLVRISQVFGRCRRDMSWLLFFAGLIQTSSWLKLKELPNASTLDPANGYVYAGPYLQYGAPDVQRIGYDSNLGNVRLIVTAPRQLPRVDYSFCRTGDEDIFSACCQEKVENGWYPLNTTTGVSGNSYAGGTFFGQAFGVGLNNNDHEPLLHTSLSCFLLDCCWAI